MAHDPIHGNCPECGHTGPHHVARTHLWSRDTFHCFGCAAHIDYCKNETCFELLLVADKASPHCIIHRTELELKKAKPEDEKPDYKSDQEISADIDAWVQRWKDKKNQENLKQDKKSAQKSAKEEAKLLAKQKAQAEEFKKKAKKAAKKEEDRLKAEKKKGNPPDLKIESEATYEPELKTKVQNDLVSEEENKKADITVVTAVEGIDEKKQLMDSKFSFTASLQAVKLLPQIINLPKEIIKEVTAMGHPVSGLNQLHALPMSQLDVLAQKYVKKSVTANSAQGASMGFMGLLFTIAEMPMFLTINFQLLCRISCVYGYDPFAYEELGFIIKLLELGLTDSTQDFVSDMEAYLEPGRLQKEGDEYEVYNKEAATRECDRAFNKIATMKLAQSIPVIGSAVGLSLNWKITSRLGEGAMMAYRKRRLIESKILSQH